MLCLNLHNFSVPGLWRATQQPAGVRKICILVCKLLGVKILCCVPRVMPDMWKRSIICKEQRASSCCRKQFENRFKEPSSMFQKLVDGACNQNVYEGSTAAYDFSITQARHRNCFTAQRRVSTASKLTPQMSMHRQSKKQAAISAPRHCYTERENPLSDGPRFCPKSP